MIIGNIVGIPGAVVLGWQLGSSLGGREANDVALIAGGIGFLGGMIIALSGQSAIKKSVDIYNKEIQQPVARLDFGLTQHGIGLRLRF